jgi:hypothetical protein
MEYVFTFLRQLWLVCLEAAPWLLLGLVVSGLIKAYLPAGLLRRWLGGRGAWPVLKAAVIGTPLPLCSCSVIPAAVTLRRSGASKESTVSFLVATPENGADSIALSYALLGPFMTIARPVAALISAVSAGMLTYAFARSNDDVQTTDETQADEGDAAASSCCSTQSGCSSNATPAEQDSSTRAGKLKQVYRFAIDDLFKDIAGWLALGLALAALMNTFVPPDAMAQWGSGILAMLAVMAVGVPMYICATASTPVAASMLLAGVSPGTVLVFLLAGPATNLATLGVVRRELGNGAVAAYLVGVGGGAVACGLLADWLIGYANWSVDPASGAHQDIVPAWLAYASLAALGVLGARLIVQIVRGHADVKAMFSGADHEQHDHTPDQGEASSPRGQAT